MNQLRKVFRSGAWVAILGLFWTTGPSEALAALAQDRQEPRDGRNHETGSDSSTTPPRLGNRKLPQVAGADRLNSIQAWPVSIAYFEPRSEGRDALPVYEISFLMFENGVSRRLHIDYGDFALQGELTEIAFHEPSKCDQK